MFSIKNLRLVLKKDFRVLIDDFSLSISDTEPWRKIALIGEEGNGKSTILKAFFNPSLIDSYIDVQGEIVNKGERLAYLPQQLEAEQLLKSTADFFYEEVDWNVFDYSHFYRLLGELDFSENHISEQITLRQLSGGEKIKLQLLKILLKNPSVLLLDEPTNDLDLESVMWFQTFLQQVQAHVIFVSHDEDLLTACANTIIHLEQVHNKRNAVHTIANQVYKAYVQNRDNLFDKQTQMARKDKEEFDEKMERYNQIRERVQHELRSTSRQDPSAAKNLKDKMHSVKSMGRRFEKEKEQLRQRPVREDKIDLRFSSLITIPKGKTILTYEKPSLLIGDKILSQNLKLSIVGPEKICLIGANGAGKTTLLRSIMDALEALNINCGYMPQDYSETMDPAMDAITFLSIEHSRDELTRIRTYLGSVKFTAEEMQSPIGTLSGGQKAKLFLAKMILHKAAFLILDEPTRNLSPLSGPELRYALRDFNGGILAVSHDRRFINEVCERVLLLDKSGLHELSSFELADRGLRPHTSL